MKTCAKCGVEKPLSEFVKDNRKKDGHAGSCLFCKNQVYQLWRNANKERHKNTQLRYEVKNPHRHLMSKFGVSPDIKMEMLSDQGGKCAACGSASHNSKNKKASSDGGWCIDHDHETGKIRGVLCWPCNVTLGHAKECPDRLRGLVEYIENAAINTLMAGAGTAHELRRHAV